MHPTLRLAEARDAETLRSIYNHEVTGSTVTFDIVARTAAQQAAWIAAHAGAHPAVVATLDDEVVAFGSLSRYRDRPAYSTTVEDSVYVHHEHRRRGLGRFVLTELVRMAQEYGYHAVVARIVGGHHASIALHSGCGFEVAGIERQVGRKFGRWLDVVVMELLVDGRARHEHPVPHA